MAITITNKIKSSIKAALRGHNRHFTAILAALEGDIVIKLHPASKTLDATAAVWSLTIGVTIEDSKGNLHSWLNDTFTAKVSASDDSTAGTAAVGSANLVVTEGKGSIVLSGDAAAWLAEETATATLANLSILGYTVTGKACIVTFE